MLVDCFMVGKLSNEYTMRIQTRRTQPTWRNSVYRQHGIS